jgi:hypothetical protein
MIKPFKPTTFNAVSETIIKTKTKYMRLFTMIFVSLFAGFTSTYSQKNWQPFAGLNISLNSDAYYAGPSFSAGITHPIGKKKKWQWAPEVTYFKKSIFYSYSPTESEKDRFLSFSIRSNFNYQTSGKKPGRGFFIGGGIGFQKASDECWTITQTGAVKEVNAHYDAIKYAALMFTFNAGYAFPLMKNKSLQVLTSAIGPYAAKDDYGSYMEVISVLSTGVRIVL